LHDLETLAQAVASRIFIPLEASGRHVHVTEDQALTLFGHSLTPQRPLSQPGQYLAKERLTVVGPKGEFTHVAVLGPARKEAQVELSRTDARTLGLDIPVRLSGDVADSPGAILRGPQGQVNLTRGVIAAQRHIHITPGDAQHFGVTDGAVVRLKTYTSRPVTFEDVAVRVSPDFATAAHLDYDEANACGLERDGLGRILP